MSFDIFFLHENRKRGEQEIFSNTTVQKQYVLKCPVELSKNLWKKKSFRHKSNFEVMSKALNVSGCLMVHIIRVNFEFEFQVLYRAAILDFCFKAFLEKKIVIFRMRETHIWCFLCIKAIFLTPYFCLLRRDRLGTSKVWVEKIRRICCFISLKTLQSYKQNILKEV